MNTEKAKVPDDSASNWQAIDVFLFSNGQQYSPPRKYHLCNEELNWWKSTLSFLAKAQYGSLHSIIDLYTIDGHKVEGPLELSNGNAYVAVTPPDSFIDSGYDKYLLKASRSWEKRQARKSSSLEITVQENIEAKQSKSDITFEDVDHKAVGNTTTIEAVSANTHEDQLSMKVGPLPHNQQTALRNTPTPIKTIEKKKPTSIQRTSILRNMTQPITSPPTNRKTSLKSNNMPLRRNSKGPVKTNEKLTPSNNNKSTVNSKIVSKTPNNVKEIVPMLVQTKINQGSSEIASSSSVTKISTSKHKSSITDNAQIENVIDDKDIIVVSNFYRNSRGEISSVIADEVENQILSQNPQIKLPSDNKIEETLPPEPVNNLGHTATTMPILGSINSLNSSISQHKITSTIKIINTPEAQHSRNNVINSDQPAGNNYLAFVHNGDVVNIKFQIEIRDGEGALCTRPEKNKHISLKKDSHMNTEEEIIVQSTPLQSLFDKEISHNTGTDGKCKIVIVKCDCYEQYNVDTLQTQDIENKKCVILLPNVRREESITSCHCEEGIPSNNEDVSRERDKPRVDSIYIPIKKTCSASSLATLAKSKRKQGTVVTQKEIETVVSKKDSSVFHSEEYQTNEHDNMLAVRNATLMKKEDSKIKYILNYSDPKTEETKLFVLKSNHTTAPPNNVMDKFTQTEWCSILLEARRHQDGHYTFHLPPLDVLRSYCL